MPAPSSLFFALKKLKPARKVLDALRHNKRLIQAELGSYAQIDPVRSTENYSLGGCDSPEEGFEWIKHAIQQYNKRHFATLRKDAVVALEAVFSLPAGRTDVDAAGFFDDCLAWLSQEFPDCPLISADVHLDESSPHLHVVIGCVLPDRLTGSNAVGFGKRFNDRNTRFFEQVGKRYGLAAPVVLSKRDRVRISEQVIRALQSSNDPVLRSRCFPAIRRAVESDPMTFATALGLDAEVSQLHPQRMRTFAQIFTSRGKGPRCEKDENYPV